MDLYAVAGRRFAVAVLQGLLVGLQGIIMLMIHRLPQVKTGSWCFQITESDVGSSDFDVLLVRSVLLARFGRSLRSVLLADGFIFVQERFYLAV